MYFRDKLSLFMESRGAASPGILTLTTSLSKVRYHIYSNCMIKLYYFLKPFKRLEKYPTLLKELQRNLGVGIYHMSVYTIM